MCVHTLANEIILALSFSHIVQSAPASESNWVDRGKLLDHSCRHCPWLPVNQHAAVTLSQWWILIGLLIALHLLSKSETRERKLSLVQVVYQHYCHQFCLKNHILACHNRMSSEPCDYIFTSVVQEKYDIFLSYDCSGNSENNNNSVFAHSPANVMYRGLLYQMCCWSQSAPGHW